jgi:hypothetical protein
MAHLIEINGSEREIDPPREDGFAWADFVALLGPDLKIVVINEFIVVVVPDLPEELTTKRNDKATRILRMVFEDSTYEVYGNALFVAREELAPFLRELETTAQLGSIPHSCDSRIPQRGKVLRWPVSAGHC